MLLVWKIVGIIGEGKKDKNWLAGFAEAAFFSMARAEAVPPVLSLSRHSQSHKASAFLRNH